MGDGDLKMSKDEQIIGKVESVCPVCLKRTGGSKILRGNNVYIRKMCPEHGSFETVIWRGIPSYTKWLKEQKPVHPVKPMTEVKKGCPFDCGLCSDHEQRPCCVLLELTMRCNIGCNFCFASSGGKDLPKDPSLDKIKWWYERILEHEGHCNIQLSGGEPTLRDDLPEIIKIGRSLGFTYFQLNTNGLRLAQDPEYLGKLKKAGLKAVFLQFDGTSDDIYEKLRGRPLLEEKLQAIENCKKEGLGVVLVPTLVPGVNTHNIGDIIRFGLKNSPFIRGVHFQPVSYFGRFPEAPKDEQRITLPEVMQKIEQQTDGLVKIQNMVSPNAQHSICSFNSNFVYMPDGTISPLTRQTDCCCRQDNSEASVKTRQFVASRWSASETPKNDCCSPEKNEIKTWDDFLERAKTHSFTISAMAFQDAWTLDLDRLRRCCINIMSPDGKLIPFCAYNLTNCEGIPLYRMK